MAAVLKQYTHEVSCVRIFTTKQVYTRTRKDIKTKKKEQIRHVALERSELFKVPWPRNLNENVCMRDLQFQISKDTTMIN